MPADFFVEIIESSRELTPKERILIKQTQGANRLDEITRNGEVVITPTAYAILRVNNERSKGDKVYETMVLIDENGALYITGSVSFRNSILQSWDDYTELRETGEKCAYKVYRVPSKNFKGKEFIAASII